MALERSRFAAVALAVLAVTFYGCGVEKTEAPVEVSAQTGGAGAPEPADPNGAVAAPDFVLQDLDGNPVRLSDYDGHVRLVDFWTTWCAPCREEIPMFKELQETYGPDGFTILAIAMDDAGLEVIKPFAEKHQLSYLNLVGTKEVEGQFVGVMGYPTAFLIDRNGNIVGKPMFGPKPRKVLEKKIVDLLGEDPT